MQIQSIVQLLQQTFNSNSIHQAENTLLAERQKPQFIKNLLLISDNTQYNIGVRQAALVYLKNAIVDDYKNIININDNDFQAIKSHILHALIRHCQQKQIAPTIRQVIFVLAESYFPKDWPQVIPQIANNLLNSSDFDELFGSIDALKAIVSAVVKKVDLKMTLENLCNKIVLPLLSLASKLFQNYNQTTSYMLIAIFKIFSTITTFHIPQIVLLNMYQWMIFIKKLMDLNIDSTNIDMNMYQLKKMCLRIMYRFYQKHLKRRFSDLPSQAIDDFHQKFTKGITQSLLLQIINEGQIAKNSTNKNYIQLTKYSLACLSCLYSQDKNAAMLIDQYKQKIIYLCLQRYKSKITKNYHSYSQFSSKLNAERIHICSFLKQLIYNSHNNIQQTLKILGYLYEHIQKGDMDFKQLCLYIYSQIAGCLPQQSNQVQQKMLMFILNIVNPLLKNNDSPIIIKLRCCQILTKYSYIQIPQNQITDIAGGVYGCLNINSNNHPDSSSMQTFLQIHAVYAFNSLLRYDSIINFTSPHLSNILPVYTSLLQTEFTMIKCLEDLLAKFEAYIQPYGNDLIGMLADMFFKYHDMAMKYKSGQIPNNNYKNNNQEEYDSQDDQNVDSTDNNYVNSSKACLGTIRQIIQIPEFVFERDQLIHNLLISIFSDKDQLYVEEGFNILNQIIFKSKNLKPQYNIYFNIIIFGILPIDVNYVNNLKKQNSNYNNALLKMLECQCAEPDADYIENTIGCLRNFISKYQDNLRSQIDKSGASFLDLLLNAVKYVHQNQSNKSTQTDRSIILTIYMSLIEWRALNDDEVKDILQNVCSWLNMEKQACYQNNKQQNQSTNTSTPKTSYVPIYLQIILLACHFYPEATLKNLNGNWIVIQILQNWQRFHIDYEICRLLIGIADLLNFQSINDQQAISQLMNKLPQIIERQCKIRIGEEDNDVQSVDDQAEEEKYFGQNQNTHIMGWVKPNQNQNQNQNQNTNQMQDEDDSDEDQQEEEFNKYYESPLDGIDEIKYLSNVLLSGNCSNYMKSMNNDMQQRLSYWITNTPPKFNNQN